MTRDQAMPYVSFAVTAPAITRFSRNYVVTYLDRVTESIRRAGFNNELAARRFTKTMAQRGRFANFSTRVTERVVAMV